LQHIAGTQIQFLDVMYDRCQQAFDAVLLLNVWRLDTVCILASDNPARYFWCRSDEQWQQQQLYSAAAFSPVRDVCEGHSLSSRDAVGLLSNPCSLKGLSSTLHLGACGLGGPAQHLGLLSKVCCGRLLRVPPEAQVFGALLDSHLSKLVDTKLQARQAGDA
jgi:hypothetical protein